MILIICSSSDGPALWAYRELVAARGPEVVLVAAEALALAGDWEHRVGNDGTGFSCVLPDGRHLSDRTITGVLNRLIAPPQEVLSHALPADRDYAMQELTAFYLSWLHALSVPVVNRPTPQGLAGRWFHASEWALLAHRAGLPTPIYRQSGEDPPDAGYGPLCGNGAARAQVIVFDGEVFGAAVPADLRPGCVKLAALSGAQLLGIDFIGAAEDAWSFAHATPLPDLQIGGAGLVARLGHHFAEGARA